MIKIVKPLPAISLAALPSGTLLYVPIAYGAGWPDPSVSASYDPQAVKWSLPTLANPGEWLSESRGIDGGRVLLRTIEGLLAGQHGDGLGSNHWLFEAEPSGPSIEPFPIMESDFISGYRASDARLTRHVRQWSRAAELEFSVACLEHAMQGAVPGDFPVGIQEAALLVIHAARQQASAYRLIPESEPPVSYGQELIRVSALARENRIDLPNQASIDSACKFAASAAQSTLGFAQPLAEAIAQDPVSYRNSGRVAERCRLAVQCLLGDPYSAASSTDPEEKAHLEAEWYGAFFSELDWQASMLRSLLYT